MLRALLLSVALVLSACEAPEPIDMDTVESCAVQPLRSTYIVSCGDDERGICRGATGELLYADCALNEGTEAAPHYIMCVTSCE